MTGTPYLWAELAGALIAGMALGFFHFGTLAWVSCDYLAGRAGRAIMVQALRMLFIFAGLFALARLGAEPLLCGALGIVAARAILLRRRGKLT